MDLRALEGHRPEGSQCSELLMPLQGLESPSALKCLCTIPILHPFHCITSWHGQHQVSPKQSLPLPAKHASRARMSPLKFRAVAGIELFGKLHQQHLLFLLLLPKLSLLSPVLLQAVIRKANAAGQFFACLARTQHAVSHPHPDLAVVQDSPCWDLYLQLQKENDYKPAD